MAVHANYINGGWSEAAEPVPDINPSNVKDVVGEYARAGEAQVRAAIAAARAAFPAWSHGPIQARADMLERSATRSWRARRSSASCSRARRARPSPRASARRRGPGISSSSSPARWCARRGEILPSVRPGIKVEITREPVGVVGIITPWNFPIAIPAWKIAPGARLRQLRGVQARRPGARLRLGARRDHRARRASGGRLQPGDGARLGGRRDALERPRRGRDQLHRFGRGGRGGGEELRGATLQEVQLEMGGKNPQVVLDDADSTPRSTSRSRARSSPPGNAARRRAGSS